MLDELREKASESDYLGEADRTLDYADRPDMKTSPRLFLGMTPIQRLVVAVMILLMACVMGSFLLLVTEKVFFPFL